MIADIKKRALHRTRILAGQLRGIEQMIEDEEYCVDIITQSLAVQKSLKSLNKLLVENHLRTHVASMFAEAATPRRAPSTSCSRSTSSRTTGGTDDDRPPAPRRPRVRADGQGRPRAHHRRARGP